jgi:MbtH protein
MIEHTKDETGQYQVVVNDEEQYSVWPLALPQALGWFASSPPFVGSRESCLEHIQGIWHDIRPRSMRREGA